jgi:hypothetical protein
VTTGESQIEPAHVAWFRSVEREISEEYERLHKQALADPQRAGHGGEATWANLLREWLPQTYNVVTRKYILPEVGDKTFETDIVVLNPSYPERLHGREEILAGGVAAAFSVRLTADAAGIRDAFSRAVELRRALQPRSGTPRDEMLAPFPVGFLAHAHKWNAASSTPIENVDQHLHSLDDAMVAHPRETLDYLCIADLGMWVTMRIPFFMMQTDHLPAPDFGMPVPLLGRMTTQNPGLATEAREQLDKIRYVVGSAISRAMPGGSYTTIGTFVAHLLSRLSYADPSLRSLAVSLRASGALGTAQGALRPWQPASVLSQWNLNQVPNAILQGGSDLWGSAWF